MRLLMLSLAILILLTSVATRAQFPSTASQAGAGYAAPAFTATAPNVPQVYGVAGSYQSNQPNEFQHINTNFANPTGYRTGTRTRTIVEHYSEKLAAEEVKRLSEFQSSVAEMRKKHDSKEAKEKARAAVEKMVVEQLDRDIQNREKQLSEIEEQVKQLRDQLEQRKSSRPELLKLLMMMIESPSSGIGLPSEWLGAINGQRIAESIPTGAYNSVIPSPVFLQPASVPTTQPVQQN